DLSDINLLREISSVFQEPIPRSLLVFSPILDPSIPKQGVTMIRRFVGAAALVVAVLLPVASQAQGVPGGVERGARDGDRAAGPVGAVVGGQVGGVVQGVAGVLGTAERPHD